LWMFHVKQRFEMAFPDSFPVKHQFSARV